MAAAVGKMSALVPTVFFSYIGNIAKFWVLGWPVGLLHHHHVHPRCDR